MKVWLTTRLILVYDLEDFGLTVKIGLMFAILTEQTRFAQGQAE